MAKYRIRVAFSQELGSSAMPWLISAYDEYTEDSWNGTPDFHYEAIESEGTNLVREMWIEVDEAAVLGLFAVPTVDGSASYVCGTD